MLQTQEVSGVKVKAGRWLALALLGAAVSFGCFIVPIFVIRPFHAQDPRALQIALAVRDAGPWLSALCVALVLLLTIRLWSKTRVVARIVMACLLLGATAGAVFTHINIFERMFYPYGGASFVGAAEAAVDPDEKVLAVTIGREARAYPLLTIGYHHIVNDTVGGVPIAVTYCTLCHTGLVWGRVVDGKTLYFHLAGINNGNALLRDEQTNTVWQQSTGEAIYGPLKGRQLNLVRSDELSFALWKGEQPQGQVLKPNPPYVPEYDSKDWEKHVEQTRTVVDTSKSGIRAHQLMVGVTFAGENKAYPIETIFAEKVIQDRVGGKSVLVVVGPDGASIRVFEGMIQGKDAVLTFTGGSGDVVMNDTQTGSDWNFHGCAVKGAFTGQCLKEIDSHKDYWFDWMNQHPESSVFKS
jgi:hypothetical protein